MRRAAALAAAAVLSAQLLGSAEAAGTTTPGVGKLYTNTFVNGACTDSSFNSPATGLVPGSFPDIKAAMDYCDLEPDCIGFGPNSANSLVIYCSTSRTTGLCTEPGSSKFTTLVGALEKQNHDYSCHLANVRKPATWELFEGLKDLHSLQGLSIGYACLTTSFSPPTTWTCGDLTAEFLQQDTALQHENCFKDGSHTKVYSQCCVLVNSGCVRFLDDVECMSDGNYLGGRVPEADAKCTLDELKGKAIGWGCNDPASAAGCDQPAPCGPDGKRKVLCGRKSQYNKVSATWSGSTDGQYYPPMDDKFCDPATKPSTACTTSWKIDSETGFAIGYVCTPIVAEDWYSAKMTYKPKCSAATNEDAKPYASHENCFANTYDQYHKYSALVSSCAAWHHDELDGVDFNLMKEVLDKKNCSDLLLEDPSDAQFDKTNYLYFLTSSCAGTGNTLQDPFTCDCFTCGGSSSEASVNKGECGIATKACSATVGKPSNGCYSSSSHTCNCATKTAASVQIEDCVQACSNLDGCVAVQKSIDSVSSLTTCSFHDNSGDAIQAALKDLNAFDYKDSNIKDQPNFCAVKKDSKSVINNWMECSFALVSNTVYTAKSSGEFAWYCTDASAVHPLGMGYPCDQYCPRSGLRSVKCCAGRGDGRCVDDFAALSKLRMDDQRETSLKVSDEYCEGPKPPDKCTPTRSRFMCLDSLVEEHRDMELYQSNLVSEDLCTKTCDEMASNLDPSNAERHFHRPVVCVIGVEKATSTTSTTTGSTVGQVLYEVCKDKGDCFKATGADDPENPCNQWLDVGEVAPMSCSAYVKRDLTPEPFVVDVSQDDNPPDTASLPVWMEKCRTTEILANSLHAFGGKKCPMQCEFPGWDPRCGNGYGEYLGVYGPKCKIDDSCMAILRAIDVECLVKLYPRLGNERDVSDDLRKMKDACNSTGTGWSPVLFANGLTNMDSVWSGNNTTTWNGCEAFDTGDELRSSLYCERRVSEAKIKFTAITKVKRATRDRDCAAPPQDATSYGNIECPKEGCLNGNAGYNDYNQAWDECGNNPDCNFLVFWTDGYIYLRRDTDPSAQQTSTYNRMQFQCQEEIEEVVSQEFKMKNSENVTFRDLFGTDLGTTSLADGRGPNFWREVAGVDLQQKRSADEGRCVKLGFNLKPKEDHTQCRFGFMAFIGWYDEDERKCDNDRNLDDVKFVGLGCLEGKEDDEAGYNLSAGADFGFGSIKLAAEVLVEEPPVGYWRIANEGQSCADWKDMHLVDEMTGTDTPDFIDDCKRLVEIDDTCQAGKDRVMHLYIDRSFDGNRGLMNCSCIRAGGPSDCSYTTPLSDAAVARKTYKLHMYDEKVKERVGASFASCWFYDPTSKASPWTVASQVPANASGLEDCAAACDKMDAVSMGFTCPTAAGMTCLCEVEGGTPVSSSSFVTDQSQCYTQNADYAQCSGPFELKVGNQSFFLGSGGIVARYSLKEFQGGAQIQLQCNEENVEWYEEHCDEPLDHLAEECDALMKRRLTASSSPVEVVLAHYTQDLSWVNDFSDRNAHFTIYSKGDPAPQTTELLPNVGRESHTYLYHIVNHYDTLAPWSVFMQAAAPSFGYRVGDKESGHMTDNVVFDDYLTAYKHGRDSFFALSAVSHFPSYKQATRLGFLIHGYKNVTSDICPLDGENGWTPWWQISDHPHVGHGEYFLEFYRQNIAAGAVPRLQDLTLAFAQGAIFAVSRERIHRRPKEYYANLLSYVSREKHPVEGYFLEASWYDVFHPEKLQANRPACAYPMRELGPAWHMHQLYDKVVQLGQDPSNLMDWKVKELNARRLAATSDLYSPYTPYTPYVPDVSDKGQGYDLNASLSELRNDFWKRYTMPFSPHNIVKSNMTPAQKCYQAQYNKLACFRPCKHIPNYPAWLAKEEVVLGDLGKLGGKPPECSQDNFNQYLEANCAMPKWEELGCGYYFANGDYGDELYQQKYLEIKTRMGKDVETPFALIPRATEGECLHLAQEFQECSDACAGTHEYVRNSISVDFLRDALLIPASNWTAGVLYFRPGETVSGGNEAEFNRLFHLCPVVRYVRNDLVHSVYVRKTHLTFEFDAWELFANDWKSFQGNVPNVDFALYSSLEDAEEGTRQWQHVNFGTPGSNRGYPGESGVQKNVSGLEFGAEDDRGAYFEVYSGAGCIAEHKGTAAFAITFFDGKQCERSFAFGRGFDFTECFRIHGHDNVYDVKFRCHSEQDALVVDLWEADKMQPPKCQQVSGLAMKTFTVVPSTDNSSLGANITTAGPASAGYIMSLADADKDGYVTWNELQASTSMPTRGMLSMSDMFPSYDSNKDKRLSLDELTLFLAALESLMKEPTCEALSSSLESDLSFKINPLSLQVLPTCVIPSMAPSPAPSMAPSAAPSPAPSMVPSAAPTIAPSAAPSMAPSPAPSVYPSAAPSMSPTFVPSLAPSPAPSFMVTVPTPGPTWALQFEIESVVNYPRIYEETFNDRMAEEFGLSRGYEATTEFSLECFYGLNEQKAVDGLVESFVEAFGVDDVNVTSFQGEFATSSPPPAEQQDGAMTPELVLRLGDVDRSGTLSKQEVTTLAQAQGVDDSEGLQSISAAFDQSDIDGNGLLDWDELKAFVASMESDSESTNGPPPEYVMQMADSNNDSHVTLEELEASGMFSSQMLSMLADRFPSRDLDGDNKLSLDELKSFLASLEPPQSGPTEPSSGMSADYVMQMADSNEDGTVTLEELQASGFFPSEMQASLADYFPSHDLNNDKRLDLNELRSFLQAVDQVPTQETPPRRRLQSMRENATPVFGGPASRWFRPTRARLLQSGSSVGGFRYRVNFVGLTANIVEALKAASTDTKFISEMLGVNSISVVQPSIMKAKTKFVLYVPESTEVAGSKLDELNKFREDPAKLQEIVMGTVKDVSRKTGIAPIVENVFEVRYKGAEVVIFSDEECKVAVQGAYASSLSSCFEWRTAGAQSSLYPRLAKFECEGSSRINLMLTKKDSVSNFESCDATERLLEISNLNVSLLPFGFCVGAREVSTGATKYMRLVLYNKAVVGWSAYAAGAGCSAEMVELNYESEGNTMLSEEACQNLTLQDYRCGNSGTKRYVVHAGNSCACVAGGNICPKDSQGNGNIFLFTPPSEAEDLSALQCTSSSAETQVPTWAVTFQGSYDIDDPKTFDAAQLEKLAREALGLGDDVKFDLSAFLEVGGRVSTTRTISASLLQQALKSLGVELDVKRLLTLSGRRLQSSTTTTNSTPASYSAKLRTTDSEIASNVISRLSGMSPNALNDFFTESPNTVDKISPTTPKVFFMVNAAVPVDAQNDATRALLAAAAEGPKALQDFIAVNIGVAVGATITPKKFELLPEPPPEPVPEPLAAAAIIAPVAAGVLLCLCCCYCGKKLRKPKSGSHKVDNQKVSWTVKTLESTEASESNPSVERGKTQVTWDLDETLRSAFLQAAAQEESMREEAMEEAKEEANEEAREEDVGEVAETNEVIVTLGLPAYESGQLVEYYSVSNRQWVSGCLSVESSQGGRVRYDVSIAKMTQLRQDTPLQYMRPPLARGEPCEYYSSREDKWFNAVIIGPQMVPTLRGYKVLLDNGDSGSNAPRHMVLAYPTRLRRRFDVGCQVEVYTGPERGWQLATVSACDDTDKQGTRLPSPVPLASPREGDARGVQVDAAKHHHEDLKAPKRADGSELKFWTWIEVKGASSQGPDVAEKFESYNLRFLPDFIEEHRRSYEREDGHAEALHSRAKEVDLV
eukprot:TRINITY_DN14722_c0_g1_i10.p1 TRINITY_DN14722_c0_g1~~TRINITY_DN14722_c0_g1_i10.p1  ORF type:complete len:3728 (+),score=644.46 TRINITY_DN14722_c0_g1_i10:172-11355(+)